MWFLTGNLTALYLLLEFAGMRFNVTNSYPKGLYVAESGAFGVGDLVEACVPAAAAELAWERRYLGRGGPCDGVNTVLKRIAAVAGDTVAITDRVVVNGEVIENAPILREDAAGRALEPAAGGVVGANHVWLLSTHVTESFDSRYFGEVPTSAVIRRMQPLWTF